MGAMAHGDKVAAQRASVVTASGFMNSYEAGGLSRKFEGQNTVRWKGKRRAGSDIICNTGGIHVQHQASGLSTM